MRLEVYRHRRNQQRVIALTIPDDEGSASSTDKDTSGEDAMKLDDEAIQSLIPSSAGSDLIYVYHSSSQREGHNGKALVAPLPTVLTYNWLGIRLSARTVERYKAGRLYSSALLASSTSPIVRTSVSGLGLVARA